MFGTTLFICNAVKDARTRIYSKVLKKGQRSVRSALIVILPDADSNYNYALTYM